MRVQGISTAVTVAGDGNPLIILHGWGNTAASFFDAVITALAERGFAVYAPDLPGFGATAPPSEPWGVPEYAEFVAELIRALGLPRVSLIGHSFGGRVSAMLAATHPELVERLVLYDASGIRHPLTLRQQIVRALAKCFGPFFALPILHRVRDAVRAIFYRFVVREQDYAHAQGIMREISAQVIAHDITPYLQQIKAPTLVLWGGRDRATPLADGKIFHACINGSKLVVEPEGGHAWHRVMPEKWIEQIINFIAGKPLST